MALETTLYEKIDDGQIVKITMNRPELLNAMDHGQKEELYEAFQMAEEDENVRVVILAGAGRSWSAGHDLSGKGRTSQHPSMTTKLTGLEASLKREQHIYMDINLYIRNLSKPVIAPVQGHCIAGGLMVACMCDIIYAAENASFGNPVVGLIPAAAAELLVEPWEMGVRRAKEFLFTGERIDAQEAYRVGLVNKVVPLEKLEEETLTLARKIAKAPSVTVSLVKRSLNRTLDFMGQRDSWEYHLLIHEMSHHVDQAKALAEARRAAVGNSGLKGLLAFRDGTTLKKEG